MSPEGLKRCIQRGSIMKISNIFRQKSFSIFESLCQSLEMSCNHKICAPVGKLDKIKQSLTLQITDLQDIAKSSLNPSSTWQGDFNIIFRHNNISRNTLFSGHKVTHLLTDLKLPFILTIPIISPVQLI